MVAFAYYFTIMYYHATHHRVGCYMAYTFYGKVEAALHVVFVVHGCEGKAEIVNC